MLGKTSDPIPHTLTHYVSTSSYRFIIVLNYFYFFSDINTISGYGLLKVTVVWILFFLFDIKTRKSLVFGHG